MAEHTGLKELRVIKVIARTHPQYAVLIREAQLLRSVSHPAIPQIYDAEETKEGFVMILEYKEGEPLSVYLRRQQYLPETKLLQIVCGLCEILVYLHGSKETGILHLDIKPEHLLLHNDMLFLIDFGSAVRKAERTETSVMFGSPLFCAPEQKAGAAPDDETDIYQVGCLLRYLMKYALTKSEGLVSIMKNCLRQGKHRYLSAQELLAALDRLSDVTKGRQNSAKRKIVSTAGHTVSIGLFGVYAGAGVTFTALSTALFLKKTKGSSVAVLECTNHGSFAQLEQELLCPEKTFTDSREFCLHGITFAKSVRTEEITLWQKKGYTYLVCDFGVPKEPLWDLFVLDRIFLIGSCQLWKQREFRSFFNKFRVPRESSLLLLGSKKQAEEFTQYVNACEVIPYIQNPFAADKESKRFYEKLYFR